LVLFISTARTSRLPDGSPLLSDFPAGLDMYRPIALSKSNEPKAAAR
jgi:hypothetical protein